MRKRTRTQFAALAVLVGAVAAGSAVPFAGAAVHANRSVAHGSLTTVTFATAAAASTPLFENIYIAQALGYFAHYGIAPVFVSTGSNAAATAEIGEGKAQIAVGTPSYQVGVIASGQSDPGINYYEYSYPSKWFLVVGPHSSITKVSQLVGKTVGITSFGTADAQVLGALLANDHVAPSSVHETVVGSGTPAGVALNNGSIQAYFAWDTTLGQFSVSGIGYKIIVSPQDLPKVGGFYLQAAPSYLRSHQKIAVGFAQAVARATLFALDNPKAAAALYLKMYPNAASTESMTQQINDIVTTVHYRAKHWLPYKNPAKIGYIQLSEWHNEVRFDGGGNVTSFPYTKVFTDKLIAQIDDFSAARVKQQAKNYRY